MKKVLVLGASGFLGKSLIAKLKELGNKVTALDRNWPKTLEGVHCVVGDFCDQECLSEVMKGQDVVFHLVSTTVPATSNDSPIFDCESNILGSLKVLEAMKENGVAKIIFASSGGTVYGIPQNTPTIESVDGYPISAYGIGKIAIEKYLYLYSHLHGINAIALRLSNPYGPGQDPEKGQGVIAAFVKRALHGETIEIWGDGSVVRDFVYIDDVIDAFVLAMEASSKFEVLNIGSGKGKSLLEILSVIESELKLKLNIEFKDTRSCDVPRIELDVSKSREVLGWLPRCSLEQGVSNLVSYMINKDGKLKTFG